MEEVSKRFEVRVCDNRGLSSEFVEAFDSLEEAQEKVEELKRNAKEQIEGSDNVNVKSHYILLDWKIVDLAKQ